MVKSSHQVAALIKEGVEHYRNGRVQHARACWEIASELEPDNLHVKKCLQLLEHEPVIRETGSFEVPAEIAEREAETFEELPAVTVDEPGPMPLPSRPRSTPAPWGPPRPKRPTPAAPLRLKDRALVRQETPDGEEEEELWVATSELELPLESVSMERRAAQVESPPEVARAAPSSSTHQAVTKHTLLRQDKPQARSSSHADRPVGSTGTPSASFGGFDLPQASAGGTTPAGQKAAGEVSGTQVSLVAAADAASDVESAGEARPEGRREAPEPDFSAAWDGNGGSSAALRARTTFYDEQLARATAPLSGSLDSVSGEEQAAPEASPEQATAAAEDAHAAEVLSPEEQGERIAKALDSALAKEFSALLGDDVKWPQAEAAAPEELPTPAFDQSLPLDEYVRSFLLQLLSTQGDEAFAALVEAFLERDLRPLLDEEPLPQEIIEGLLQYYDAFYQSAMRLYIKQRYEFAYRLLVLCSCARPDDGRVQSNLEKLQKRLKDQ